MKRQFKYILCLLLTLFLITSCEVDQPEIKGISNFKINEFNKDEISFDIDVTAYNPNNYKIKVRKSELKFYLNDVFVGNAQLRQKYSMDKKDTTISNVPVTIILNKNVYASLIKMVAGGKVKLKLEGPLKLSVSGFPVTRDISKVKHIDLNDLGINLGKLLGS